jgi:hypothetical protein
MGQDWEKRLRHLMRTEVADPVAGYAAGVTARGDIAITFTGRDQRDGTETQCEHICPKDTAVSICATILRAVALADRLNPAAAR